MNEQIDKELHDFLYWLKEKEKSKQAEDHKTLEDIRKLSYIHDKEIWNELEDPEKFWKRGLKSISKGRVAIVLMAAGAGTRM